MEKLILTPLQGWHACGRIPLKSWWWWWLVWGRIRPRNARQTHSSLFLFFFFAFALPPSAATHLQSWSGGSWRCAFTHTPGLDRREKRSYLLAGRLGLLFFFLNFFFFKFSRIYFCRSLRPTLPGEEEEDEQHKTGAFTGEEPPDRGQPRRGEGAFWQAAGKIQTEEDDIICGVGFFLLFV